MFTKLNLKADIIDDRFHIKSFIDTTIDTTQPEKLKTWDKFVIFIIKNFIYLLIGSLLIILITIIPFFKPSFLKSLPIINPISKILFSILFIFILFIIIINIIYTKKS